jgi:hypothetical protein
MPDFIGCNAVFFTKTRKRKFKVPGPPHPQPLSNPIGEGSSESKVEVQQIFGHRQVITKKDFFEGWKMPILNNS